MKNKSILEPPFSMYILIFCILVRFPAFVNGNERKILDIDPTAQGVGISV